MSNPFSVGMEWFLYNIGRIVTELSNQWVKQYDLFIQVVVYSDGIEGLATSTPGFLISKR